MTCWKMGEKERARDWYDKSIQWLKEHHSVNRELRRFRFEAEALFAGPWGLLSLVP